MGRIARAVGAALVVVVLAAACGSGPTTDEQPDMEMPLADSLTVGGA